MKNQFLKPFAFSAIITAMIFSSCSSDDSTTDNGGGNQEPTAERYITVAGAMMQETDGDGNGGTKVFAVKKSEALNPEFSIDVYGNGEPVLSNRTARLQSSEDGNTLFNIAYTGDNGGTFSKYAVKGGANFPQQDVSVNISQYAGTSPRWAKLFDGDKTGIAVNVTAPVVNTTEDGVYINTRGVATVLALDLQNVLISSYKQFEIPLTTAEEALGHHIFRLDAPVLNKAGNKLLIGLWMRKTNPATGQVDSNFTRLGSKTLVVDYPALTNPQVITSTVGFGDTTGYRSFNSYLGQDGNIYQATQRDTGGSHILKIGQNNQYDNSYVFSLDSALGVTGSYVDSWRYAGDGIAYVMYSHAGAENQGFIARLDLNARTATQVVLPYEPGLDFGQYQGFVVDGDDVIVAVTPVGKDGNIYSFNRKTGAVTKGAKLINRAGNHYIGVF